MKIIPKILVMIKKNPAKQKKRLEELNYNIVAMMDSRFKPATEKEIAEFVDKIQIEKIRKRVEKETYT